MGHWTIAIATLLVLICSAYSYPSQVNPTESGTQKLAIHNGRQGITRALALKSTERWTDGIIPYEIDHRFDRQHVNLIYEAMNAFHKDTCIKFKPRVDEHDYIKIQRAGTCDSLPGRVGGLQYVNLAVPGCMQKGKIMHELMHAVGFMHEQSRFDRDKVIYIDENNIQNGKKINFEKYEEDQTVQLGVGYNTGSIMHYGPYYFAIDSRKPTIIGLDPRYHFGQRDGFDNGDKWSINRYYNCDINKQARTHVEPWHFGDDPKF